MIRLFDLDDVGKSAARLDPAKIANLSGIWLRRADDARLTRDVAEHLRAGIGLHGGRHGGRLRACTR